MSKSFFENPLYNKFCKDKEHAQEVCKYSLMLFDALKENTEKFKNIDEQAKDYLALGALLHDIGYCIEKKSHHKHAMNLIINEGVDGYREEEVKIIANIARYHRSAFPNPEKHETFAQFSDNNRELITLLGGIVRLADGLDKPHKNLILRINAQETENSLNLYLKTIGFKPNLKMAESKKDLLEFAFEKKINFLFM